MVPDPTMNLAEAPLLVLAIPPGTSALPTHPASRFFLTDLPLLGGNRAFKRKVLSLSFAPVTLVTYTLGVEFPETGYYVLSMPTVKTGRFFLISRRPSTKYSGGSYWGSQ